MVGHPPAIRPRSAWGQVISGWVACDDFALDGIEYATPRARELAIGGTAGQNATRSSVSSPRRSPRRRHEFGQADNLFAALGAHDALVLAGRTARPGRRPHEDRERRAGTPSGLA